MPESLVDTMALHTGGLPGVQHTAPKGTILDRAVCLVLNFAKFGNHKKASVAKIMEIARDEVRASHDQVTPNQTFNRSMVSASKKLLDSKELKAVTDLDRRVMVYLSNLALPSMFKSGVHLIPIPLVEKIETDLRTFRDERTALVDRFCEVYPDQVREVERLLCDLFNPLDYPTVEKVRLSFEFEWQYVTFGVPGTLKAIKASLFEDEKNKHAKKLEEAADACRMAMRVGMAELADKMADRLKTDDGGKKKIFKASTVENVSQFLRTFEMRNVTDDEELGVLVAKARELMNGIDPDMLRNDEDIRRSVQAGFDEIAKSLETMGVDRHTRAIDLYSETES